MKVEIIGKSKTGNEEILNLVSELAEILEIKDKNIVVEILFTKPEEIQKLNITYRKIDTPTDVLSFPQITINSDAPVLGSIAICEEIVEKKGETIPEVIIHGFMHLAGLDHEIDDKKWNEVERDIYAKIGFKKINS